MLRILILALAFLLMAPAAHAQLEEQAARQIALAQKDFDEGNYERAVNSASSALRLDPQLYDALVIKALSYEKLNESMLAYSLLVTYQELTRGMTQRPEVAPALVRLKKLITGVINEPLPSSQPAMAPSASSSAPDDGSSVQFEILSARNQTDLFRQMNESLQPGPMRVRFRSQSTDKGDDFLFGLARAAWDRDELDIDDPAFTVILDSEKLVLKARDSATLDFTQEEAEHEVQLWFDGDLLAMRVDGEAFGPFKVRAIPNGASWFLQLTDRARAWNLEARGWDGSLAAGLIPSGFEGTSREATTLEFTEHPITGRIDEGRDVSDLAALLPDVTDATELRVRFTVECTAKTYVIVRPGDGREVTLGKAVEVRGAVRVPKITAGLQCRGGAEEVELLFAPDGAVSGSVGGREFGPTYPGRKGAEEPMFRVKGDREEGWVEGLVYAVGARRAGRRVFRAGSD